MVVNQVWGVNAGSECRGRDSRTTCDGAIAMHESAMSQDLALPSGTLKSNLEFSKQRSDGRREGLVLRDHDNGLDFHAHALR
jgi:hypothetical protein